MQKITRSIIQALILFVPILIFSAQFDVLLRRKTARKEQELRLRAVTRSKNNAAAYQCKRTMFSSAFRRTATNFPKDAAH